MTASKHLHINWYVLSDAFSATISWCLFTQIIKALLHEQSNSLWENISNPFFQITIIIIPLFWVCLFMLTGFYRQYLIKKSRLNEFTSTFIICLTGTLFLFYLE